MKGLLEAAPQIVSAKENIANTENAIKNWNLGPENVDADNKPYWSKMAKLWLVDEPTARTQICGNCEYYDNTPEALKEMKDKSEALSSITDNDIKRSLSNCFDEFKKFFKDCLDKDKEIKKEIIRFREQNKLAANQAWTATITPEWEFQNKFSITKRIMEDPVISKNLQSFFSKLVEFYFFSEQGKLTTNILSKVRSYNYRFNVKKSEQDLQDITNETAADILSNLKVISSNILKDKINEIVSSPDLDFFDTSTLIDSLILNNIKLSSQIFNKINFIFQSKENIIDQQSYYAITCGVCGQTTQVPSEYKDEILSFSNIESQYSFFREDGSFISDSELEKTQYFLCSLKYIPCPWNYDG
jgi:hypothetical protein